jgi:CelD/BcsL family acetyltransferase involved in cellulose biosynthesis
MPAPPEAPYRTGGRTAIEILRTEADLVALAPEWEALWRACPEATPFQAPAWLLPWWRHFGQGRLVVPSLRRDGRLHGLLPLYIYADREARKLLPLGIGVSDHGGGLFAPDLGPSDITALLASLGDLADEWDVCELHLLPETAALRHAPAPVAWADSGHIETVCPVLALPARAEDLPAALPRRMAENLRYCQRRAARAGLEIHRAGTAQTPAALDALARLHAARWRARGLPGVWADAAVAAFHRAAAAELAAAGLLRLYVLAREGDAIAAYYGFLHRRRAFYYLSGFDPAWSALSPGTLIVAHAMTEALAEGATAFDFLRGAEPYKYRWGARDCPLHLRRLWIERK